MKVLALIPARGGSKGVKNKNIRLLDGKELIAYSIECALASARISKTVVSTDSKQIANVALPYGVEVIERPDDLATDTSMVIDTIFHVIQELEDRGESYDVVLLLQPTSPIRTFRDVDAVINILEIDSTLDGVISVVPMQEAHPARMYVVDSNLMMHSLQPENETARRQALPTVYYRNGCIYATRISAFKKTRSLMGPNKKAYVMPYELLLNIDQERDFILGEVLMKMWKAGEL